MINDSTPNGFTVFLKRGLSMMARIFLLTVVIMMLWNASALASSASLYYSDGPWMGKVIDAETKEPIERAVVLAVWDKVYATPTGRQSYFFDAIETLTDKNGTFIISIFNAVNFLPIIRHIEGPNFIIFKPGYTSFPGPAYNYFHKYFPHSPLRVDIKTLGDLFKKGVTVEVLRLKIRGERLRNIPGGPTDVNAKKLPLFYKLINEERKNLGLEGEVWR